MVFEEYKDVFEFEKIEIESKLVKVFIVGFGMVLNFGVVVEMFVVLVEKNILIKMVSIFEIKVLIVVSENDMVKVVEVLYDVFEFLKYFLVV